MSPMMLQYLEVKKEYQDYMGVGLCECEKKL